MRLRIAGGPRRAGHPRPALRLASPGSSLLLQLESKEKRDGPPQVKLTLLETDGAVLDAALACLVRSLEVLCFFGLSVLEPSWWPFT